MVFYCQIISFNLTLYLNSVNRGGYFSKGVTVSSRLGAINSSDNNSYHFCLKGILTGISNTPLN